MIVRIPRRFAASPVPLILAATLAETALAQAPPLNVLEEVTVTAQKREEKLQDVPIAVSAFSSEQLQQRGINNVHDLASIAPNVQISSATANNTGAQISIRGGVQINPALYWDPTVGIYLDGVYIGKMLGSVFDVVDLERVEVLRGPQGTLYGRNTLAGAINFVTRKPSGELGGNATVTLGNFDDRNVKVSLDLPKFGIASIGLGGRFERRDGTTDTTPGSSVKSLNDRDGKAGRFAMDLDFTDDLQAAYRFDYTDIDQNPMHSYLTRALIPPLAPYVSEKRLGVVSIDGPTFERVTLEGHALTLSWDLNEHNALKSISAYRDMTWDDALDLDGSPLPIAHTSRLSTYRTFSQELQWVGSTDRLNYVGGLYYFKDSGGTNNPQTFFVGTFNFDSRFDFGTRAWSGYGQLDYKLTDTWTLTGGLRYTSEKKDIDRQLGVNFAAGSPFITLIPQGTTAEKSFSATSPLVSIAYKINPDMNVYFKYAEGFKSGGFNGEYGDPDPSPAGVALNVAETRTPFDPEKVKAFEVGLKTTLADGRLQFNTAVFENKTKDLQLAIFRATGAASSIVRNAGKATTYGFEMESTWLPIDPLRLQLSYGYLHAKYDEFMDRGVNVAANRASVHAPKHTLNFNVDAQLVQTPWGSLHALADYTYTSSYFTYPFQLASSGPQYDPTSAIAGDTRIKSVGLTNARLSLLDIPAGNLTGEAALWCRNLTDSKHIGNNIDFGPGFGSLTDSYFIDPRTYGIEFTVRW